MSIHLPRRLALAALACGAAAPALAGGFAEPVAVPVVTTPVVTPVVVAPSGEWTGGFVGAQLGFARGTDDDFDPELEGGGALFGLNAGYNFDFGRFVLGGEVQFDAANLEFDNIGDVGELFIGTSTQEVDSVLRAGVRAGYDAGRFLPYVTGGYFSADATNDFDEAGTESGGYVGLGVDYRFSDRIVVGAQVLRHESDEFELDRESDDSDTSDESGLEFSTFGLRATYNF